MEVKFSWQAQGIVRWRRLVEVKYNVAVPLGLVSAGAVLRGSNCKTAWQGA